MELPLLLTLAMDAASFEHFNYQRQQYFPPERNHIPAHITLFHQLAANQEEQVRATLQRVAEQTAVFTMHTCGLWMMGFGVAYRIDSAQAQARHAALKEPFQPWLIPQDARPGFSPHITIQNKAKPDQAKALHAKLSSDFMPRAIEAVGLDLWRYLGGPWQHLDRFTFGR